MLTDLYQNILLFNICFYVYYKIDNESLSSQHGTSNKVGSGSTLRTPGKRLQRCF